MKRSYAVLLGGILTLVLIGIYFTVLHKTDRFDQHTNETLFTVRVCDHYVLKATVTDAFGAVAVEQANGYYTFASKPAGMLTSSEGFNDINGNGIVDPGEPAAPEMTAPPGFSHISPFTSLLKEPMSLGAIKQLFPSLQPYDSIDFDPYASSLNNTALAKDLAKAAILISYAWLESSPPKNVIDDHAVKAAFDTIDTAATPTQLNQHQNEILTHYNGTAGDQKIASTPEPSEYRRQESADTNQKSQPGRPSTASGKNTSASWRLSSPTKISPVKSPPAKSTVGTSTRQSRTAHTAKTQPFGMPPGLNECVPGVPCNISR